MPSTERTNSSSPPSPHPEAPVRIELNGEQHDVAEACSVASLVASLGLAEHRVAVAVNRAVIPRSRYAAQALAAGDRVEILEAVGGG